MSPSVGSFRRRKQIDIMFFGPVAESATQAAGPGVLRGPRIPPPPLAGGNVTGTARWHCSKCSLCCSLFERFCEVHVGIYKGGGRQSY